ncbi:parB-like partition protein (plasmid) [Gloeothece citriformis PCC 7424]|uniref:ParB-like partition protein n=1 Tax=Gloeothece citriformis (strain PCC 7424) TaxID=65393 RepID=B7KMP0_GLOC7|nr:ParB/RepB/Spo0J family partition protein [Gloeothece citriformis]ACK74062.1 parB-like partition protein [Gloeothece citriformis PCC 7424]
MNSKTAKPYKGSLTDKVDLLLGGPKTENNYRILPLSAIALPFYQPRQYFDEASLIDLSSAIATMGILEPLIVRPLTSSNYQLVAGGRRYRAAQKAGLSEVPVIIKDLSDSQALEVSILENLQREDLNPVEETEGILRLLESRLNLSREKVTSLLYRMRNDALTSTSRNVSPNSEEETLKAIFVPLGITWKSFIETRLPLLKLPSEIMAALKEGKIAYTKAVAIAKVSDDDKRENLLNEAIEQNLSLSQIKERIKLIAPKPEEDTSTTPSKSLDLINKRFKKAQLWKDPQKWKKAQGLLKKLEALLEEGEAG